MQHWQYHQVDFNQQVYLGLRFIYLQNAVWKPAIWLNERARNVNYVALK
jgi:hypothetical protein